MSIIKFIITISLVFYFGVLTNLSAVRITYSTSNSGLSSNNVKAIAIDSQGNNWIGTAGGGVNKFDGVIWTTYTATTSGLANNYVNAIVIDSQNNKWFGTDSGVSKFDGTNWTSYTCSNSGLVSSSHVACIAIDSQGNKWFGTADGISKFDGTYWVNYTSANGLGNSNNIQSIAIDSQDIKWLGTNNGVVKFDGTNWTKYASPEIMLTWRDAIVNDFGTTPSTYGDYICASSGDGTKRIVWAPNIIIAGVYEVYAGFTTGMNRATNAVYSVKDANGVITPLTVNQQPITTVGLKWVKLGNFQFNVGTSGTIELTDKADGLVVAQYIKLVFVGILSALNSDVQTIAIDSQNNKWFGTASGVSKFDGTNWTNYTTLNSGLPSNNIYTIYIDSSNNKWFGCDDKLTNFDGTNWTKYNSVTSVYSITMDTQGNKWFGRSSGVTKVGSDNLFNTSPALSYTGEGGYTTSGVYPITGDINTTFIFRVKYIDTDNDQPRSLKLHIKKGGTKIQNSPFFMSRADYSGDYKTGVIFSSTFLSPTFISTGTDYTYYIESYDIWDATATGSLTTPIDAPDVVVGGATGTPTLSATPTSLEFGEIKINESKTLQLSLSNIGSGLLSGTITANDSWITVPQSNFSGNAIVNITVNTTGMQNGDYTGTITVNSNGGNTTVTVRVKATCVLVYPNPYPLSAGKLLTFWGSGVVPNDTKIKIYTLGMDLVKTLEETAGKDTLTWNGTNDSGDRVVPGIYFYTSESPKEISTGRITVIK